MNRRSSLSSTQFWRRTFRSARAMLLVPAMALIWIGLGNSPLRAAGGAPSGATRAARPNILLIVTDDNGYNDFGFQGSKDIKTPHLDALAKQGIRFTNAYVTAAVCGASRAALLTGRYHQRHSFEDTPLGNVGLNVNEKTIADGLKAGGYATGIVGKWSVGYAEPFRPLVRGFDEFFGFLGMLHPYLPGPVDPRLGTRLNETPRPGWGAAGPGGRAGRAGAASGAATQPAAGAARAGGALGRAGAAGRGTGMTTSPGNFIGNTAGTLVRGNAEVQESEYLTEAFTRESVSFIKRHRDHPFFLYLCYSASHSPLQPTKKYLDRFPDLTGIRQLYAATTSALDDSVGEVLAALRESGQEENTLIVFINDNGGAIDDVAADNSPLGGAKFQLWEGGIRVPMLARWKGHIPEGKVVDQPVIALDLFPTFLAATNSPTPAGKELEGINLMPVLTSGRSDAAQMDRPLFWRTNNLVAVRKGKWKLTIPQAGVQTPLLFDLVADTGENTDLAAANPEVVKELTNLWNQWNEKNQPVGGRGGRG